MMYQDCLLSDFTRLVISITLSIYKKDRTKAILDLTTIIAWIMTDL